MLDAFTDRNTELHAHGGDGYCNGNHQLHTDPHADSGVNGHWHRDQYGDTHTHIDANCNSHTDASTYCNADGRCHQYPYGDIDSHPNAYVGADRHQHRDQDGDPHADSHGYYRRHLAAPARHELPVAVVRLFHRSVGACAGL